MSEQIFKYKLEIGEQVVKVPYAAMVLSVVVQLDQLMLYVRVHEAMEQGEKTNTEIQVCVRGTGIEYGVLNTSWEFRGSHLTNGGLLVWHVWTRIV